MSTGLAHAGSFDARVVVTTEQERGMRAREAQGAARPRLANRRTHRRLDAGDVQWLRAARLKYGAHVRVIDISAGGMLIETDRALTRDSKMVFELAGSERNVLVACRVLRCEPVLAGGEARFRVACAFTRPLELPDLIADAAGAPASPARVGAAEPGTAGAGQPGESHAGVGWQKVIVRYRDGQLLRGYTNNFHTDRPALHLSDAPCTGSMVMVPLSRLKALFFVREFAGNPRYVERPEFQPHVAGRKIEVTFHDGEVLLGTTISYRPDGVGFFVHPADPHSNNLRVFVVLGAVQHVRFL